MEKGVSFQLYRRYSGVEVEILHFLSGLAKQKIKKEAEKLQRLFECWCGIRSIPQRDEGQ